MLDANALFQARHGGAALGNGLEEGRQTGDVAADPADRRLGAGKRGGRLRIAWPASMRVQPREPPSGPAAAVAS